MMTGGRKQKNSETNFLQRHFVYYETRFKLLRTETGYRRHSTLCAWFCVICFENVFKATLHWTRGRTRSGRSLFQNFVFSCPLHATSTAFHCCLRQPLGLHASSLDAAPDPRMHFYLRPHPTLSSRHRHSISRLHYIFKIKSQLLLKTYWDPWRPTQASMSSQFWVAKQKLITTERWWFADYTLPTSIQVLIT
jgi:hypothetical protein